LDSLLGKRTAKEKPFWKKKQTEQEASISDHIGKLIDRLSFDDMLTLGIGAIAAYTTKEPMNFLTGMVAYKLATTDGLISQATGISLLIAMGYVSLVNLNVFTGEEKLKLEPPKPDWTCPKEYDLRWSVLGGWACVPLRPGLPPVEPTKPTS